MDKYLEKQQRLAALKGWSNVTILDGQIASVAVSGEISYPPIPRWVFDNAAALHLMVEHKLNPMRVDDTRPFFVVDGIYGASLAIVFFDEHGNDAYAALRYALVCAAIRQLEIARIVLAATQPPALAA
ncbi:hypothetical protein [Noviherbaspirillum pedocola]|uniref:Uncharacterized protein n=1 Tax=Noviherbaspirillum pedocola TaxID=2801341 RepID=A0A934W7T5_9BURK|nr:hypothetical protein [Noviherbaspirillum pedocola]MBK4735988.1 hypothetical protein [Noviherbaspirillum pedocola]